MAGVDLPVVDDMKVLGVVLDRRLTLHKHVSTVARSCYHALAVRHIRHPADYGTCTDVGLPYSLTLSRIDYCNTVLHGVPNYSTKKPQRVQNKRL